MSILNLFLIGAGFFSPVIGGWITHGLSWRWVFHIVAILSGVTVLLIFFFAPESTFHGRQEPFFQSSGARNLKKLIPPGGEPTDKSGSSTPIIHSDEDHSKSTATSSNDKGDPAIAIIPDDLTATLKARMPFVRRLDLYHGRKSNGNLITTLPKLFVRPFILLLHLPALWMTVLMGCAVSWTVFTGIVLAISFPQPPLSFSEVQVGYMYFAAIIGAVLGFLLCAFTSDPLASFMASRNQGIYEPEFRIVLVLPMAFFGFIGLYGFGVVTSDLPKYGWFWPAFFFSSQVISMVTACVATSSYIVDAYGKPSKSRIVPYEFAELRADSPYAASISTEAFVMFMIFKNLFLYLLSAKAVEWLLTLGTLRIFEILAGIHVALCLSSIPLCKYFILSCETTADLFLRYLWEETPAAAL